MSDEYYYCLGCKERVSPLGAFVEMNIKGPRGTTRRALVGKCTRGHKIIKIIKPIG